MSRAWFIKFAIGMTMEFEPSPVKIRGPDNPTCQLLPIMGNKCCSGTGKAGKTKEVVEHREVKQVVCEKLCVTKWCERWCVKASVCQSSCV